MENQGVRQEVSKRAYRFLFAVAVLTLATGTVVYHLVEKMSWLNAYYFSVITLSTVGYGDITPHTAFGKLFTTFYIFGGVGIITSFITLAVRRRGARIRARQEKRRADKHDT